MLDISNPSPQKKVLNTRLENKLNVKYINLYLFFFKYYTRFIPSKISREYGTAVLFIISCISSAAVIINAGHITTLYHYKLEA